MNLKDNKLEIAFAAGSGLIFVVGCWTVNYLACASAMICLVVLGHREHQRWRSRRAEQAGRALPAPSTTSSKTRRRDRTECPTRQEPPVTPAALVSEMIFQGRYAVLIRPEVAANLTPSQRQEVARVLREEMAEVRPGRMIRVEGNAASGNSAAMSEVAAIFTDRYAVSNAEYQEFVNAGGYEKSELWAEEIRDALSTFVDMSHKPGPRHWRNGRYAPGTADLPVVGVSWYEADAYARWVGKRLPTDAEWVKSAVSPCASVVAAEQLTRYPWGNSYRDDRANLWSAGKNQPVPVAEYPGGQTSEGLCQMIGNVWEWLADDLRQTFRGGELQGPSADFKAIRGGAFDTYIEAQAATTCTSGDSPLARRDNIGFRCVLAASDIARDLLQPGLPQNSGDKSLI